MTGDVDERYGLFRAVCINNVDPLGQWRIQVTIPAVHGPTDTYWAMPCMDHDGNPVPANQQGVWVAFEHGDVEHPVWLGVFSGLHDIATSAAQNPVVDTSWHVVGDVGQPPFQNGWNNYTDANLPDSVVRYRRSADGLVLINGALTGGTPSTGSEGIAFSLPADYRPARTQYIERSDSILVKPTGEVMVPGGTSPITLDGTVFLAEQ